MSKKLMLIGAMTLLLVAGLCAWAESRPGRLATMAQSQSTTSYKNTSANDNKKAGTRLQSQLITVRANGFEPQEFSRHKGPFLLAVINRSRIDPLTLHLDRSVGGHVKDVGIDIKTGRGAEVVDVPRSVSVNRSKSSRLGVPLHNNTPIKVLAGAGGI